VAKLSICTAIMTFIAACAAFGDVPQSVKRQWWPGQENSAEKLSQIQSRALGYPIVTLLKGRTIQRAAHTMTGLKQLAVAYWKQEGESDALFKLSDSLANPLSLINDVISDFAAAATSSQYARSGFSNRIQLCTGNLSGLLSDNVSPLHFINPAHHLAVLVDGKFEAEDPYSGEALRTIREKSGIFCTQVPLVSNESESVLIERLNCLTKTYLFEYRFMNNNCGAYTFDILHMAGAGTNAFPNGGIGYLWTKDNDPKREKYLDSAKRICNGRINQLRRVISDLENGNPLDPQDSNYLLQYSAEVGSMPEYNPYTNAINAWRTLSYDMILQLFISAARGSELSNRKFISDHFGLINPTIMYWQDSNRTIIKSNFIKMLSDMFSQLNEEQISWISSSNPETGRLHLRLRATKLTNNVRK
jgi:hypothetical protein